jgi:nicotinate-nucleotide adenylyltransferase
VPQVSRRIGILGGSFDPIHNAHLFSAEAAAAAFGLERVILVPAHQSPLKAGTRATADDRVAMVELAITGNSRLELSRIEVDRPPPSYTVETLSSLQATFPDADLHLILGADGLEYLLEWREPGRILDLCELIVLSRPGYALEVPEAVRKALGDRAERIHLQEMPLLEISSTDLRRRLGDGQPVRYLLPEPVLDYISRHRLYGVPPGPPTR